MDERLRALSEAMLATRSGHTLDEALRAMAASARGLARARYAAIGVPDDEGGFAKFIASGFTERQWDAIGQLPRQHGLLGAMLQSPESYRTHDIQQDPRFEGWPVEHPNMTSFLGVPIVAGGNIVGAFYLTDKRGRRGSTFSEEDQQLIETLAAHAAFAIEHARLWERSRELMVVEERNRLARELHDAVNQTLFSVSLTVESAALLVESDPAEAQRRLRDAARLARSAMEEMRSLIFELRPADLGAEGLVPTLRKHVDVLRRVHDRDIRLDVEGERRLRPNVERETFRIAQEALTNALRHASATRLAVRLALDDGRLALTVEDDGAGFDPASPEHGRRLGLVSMRERAEAIGGRVTIESAPGVGTTVRLEVADA